MEYQCKNMETDQVEAIFPSMWEAVQYCTGCRCYVEIKEKANND